MLTRKQIEDKIKEKKDSNKQVEDKIYNECLIELNKYMNGCYNNEILKRISSYKDFKKSLGIYGNKKGIQNIIGKLYLFYQWNIDKFGCNKIEFHEYYDINHKRYSIMISIKI